MIPEETHPLNRGMNKVMNESEVLKVVALVMKTLPDEIGVKRKLPDHYLRYVVDKVMGRDQLSLDREAQVIYTRLLTLA